MRRVLGILLVLVILGGTSACQEEYPLSIFNSTTDQRFTISVTTKATFLSEAADYAGMSTDIPPMIERPDLQATIGAERLYNLSAEGFGYPIPLWQDWRLPIADLYLIAATGVLDVDGNPMDDAVAGEIAVVFDPEDDPDPETVLSFVDAYAASQDESLPETSSVRPCPINVSEWITVPEHLDRLYTWYYVVAIHDDTGKLYHYATARADVFCGELDGGYGAWVVVYSVPQKVGIESYKINAEWQKLNVDMSVYPNL